MGIKWKNNGEYLEKHVYSKVKSIKPYWFTYGYKMKTMEQNWTNMFTLKLQYILKSRRDNRTFVSRKSGFVSGKAGSCKILGL